MKLCMPSVGSLMMLTEDWELDLEPLEITAKDNYSFEHFDLSYQTKKMTKKDYYDQDREYEYLTGKFTFPKGTLFKVSVVRFWTVNEKAAYAKRPWRQERKDYITLEVLDTALPYKVDKEVIKTKTGRISKKKPERPTITFDISPDQATFEFEFSV